MLPKSVNLPTHHPLPPDPSVSLEAFEGGAAVPVVSALMGKGQKVGSGGRGAEVTVMSSLDALLSADY